jgi:hypothetical protein
MEISKENLDSAASTATAYYAAAKKCKETGLSSDCAKEAALSLAFSAASGCGSGNVSDCARLSAINGAAGACAAYTAGAAAPICAWAAAKIINYCWPTVVSVVNSVGASVSNLGTFLLDVTGLKDAPEFADKIYKPTMAKARTEHYAAIAAWREAMLSAISKMRDDIGMVKVFPPGADRRTGKVEHGIVDVSGDFLGKEHKNEYMSLEMAIGRWFIYSRAGDCKGRPPYRKTLDDGSGSWFNYEPCLGQASWHLAGLTTDRSGKFSWARKVLQEGIAQDFERSAMIMRNGVHTLVQLELQNPETKEALWRKESADAAAWARSPAGIAASAKMQADKDSLAKKRKAELDAINKATAKQAAANKQAVNKQAVNKKEKDKAVIRSRVVVAGALSAITAGVVFAMVSGEPRQ